MDRSADPEGEIVIAALRFGNVVLIVQPPRGFGENPVAIYHDPDLPPSHHYLAAYRWLAAADGFAADAVVHLGKHGNLEWLPGKTLGMSASCGTDAALGDLPLIYPFLVNDPGEGTQAKRRAHATLVDHLIPPMARAETYGDIARLEQLLDEHANISALDPAKLPAIRQQIWTLMRAAKMDHDLGLAERPDEDSFDDMLLHVDGWLCEIKDVQIRDGLHILGQAPTGEAEVDLVLAMLRARQLWGGEDHVPGLREALGLSESGDESRERVDAVEKLARELVSAMQEADWDAGAIDGITERLLANADRYTTAASPVVGGAPIRGDRGGAAAAGDRGEISRMSARARRRIHSGRAERVAAARADQRAADRAQLLFGGPEGRALAAGVGDRSGDGGFAAGAVSGRSRRISAVGGPVGVGHLGDADLGRRYRRSACAAGRSARLGRGEPPRHHAGTDLARRAGPPAHRRDGADQSGFFRDAFPHVLAMLDDAVRLVAGLDEPAEQNYVRAHAAADLAEHGDERRSTTRIFGSKPGTYGAGLLQLIDSASWRTDDDLAQVYTAWGGFAYGRDLDGAPAADDMRSAYRRIAVAAKNTDTREHDIADSDDYFQYHGGMVATVRALTGTNPEAYIGDSTRPDAVRTRTLSEETTRVFRARVVNPRWLEAMRRHGYKGAFEMAATVDYLFGYDATDQRRGRLDVRKAFRELRIRRGQPQVHGTSPTRGRCTASPNGCSRPPSADCGSSRNGRRWTGCARFTSRPKANSSNPRIRVFSASGAVSALAVGVVA